MVDRLRAVGGREVRDEGEEAKMWTFWKVVVWVSLWCGLVGEAWGKGIVEWEVEIVEAEIRSTKANGKKWDWGFPWKQASDPFVVIEGGGQKFQTRVVMDSYRPQWKQKVIFRLAAKTRMHIRVIDKDRRFDDLIGQMDVEIGQLEAKEDWSFGQVARLRLKVKRKHETPLTWVERAVKRLERVALTSEQKERLLALGRQFDVPYAKTHTEKQEAEARLSVQLGAKYRDNEKIEQLQKKVNELESKLLGIWQSMRSEVQKLLRSDQWQAL